MHGLITNRGTIRRSSCAAKPNQPSLAKVKSVTLNMTRLQLNYPNCNPRGWMDGWCWWAASTVEINFHLRASEQTAPVIGKWLPDRVGAGDGSLNNDYNCKLSGLGKDRTRPLPRDGPDGTVCDFPLCGKVWKRVRCRAWHVPCWSVYEWCNLHSGSKGVKDEGLARVWLASCMIGSLNFTD